ncbi:sensor histidine kinase [Endobacterium cereale]|uniref:sensor histidine kinase n=1 Tax=Endobacterium cereale TaxID=2663029 RepID=UPI002B465E29|nr:HWE histidine kinase domain-containing protein [Endobacterium cereale]MEB2848381.1 HWE histidine kinase domain-containing protein [Endobacterium cereale]
MADYVFGGQNNSAKVIDEFDWSRTSLGPIETWPISLRTVVDMMLASQFPQAVVWGPELITIHNDAFVPILGDKASAIGRSFRDVWAEAWSLIGPIAERAYAGESTFIENYPLLIDRHGYEEQTYFTFCYSPLKGDDGKIVGMIDTVVETTETVLGQQRLRESEQRFRAFTAATNDMIFRMSSDLKEMQQLDGRRLSTPLDQPSIDWRNEYLLPDDMPQIEAVIAKAIADKKPFEFEHRVRRKERTVGFMLSRAVPVLDGDGEVTEWFGAATDITDRKTTEQLQGVINREMSHRLKNTLAMVQAIAVQTLRPVQDREPVEALEKRIQALSSAHDILFDRYWQTAPIKSLIASTLQRLVPSERLDAEGPDIQIGPKGALSLSLVLHELATNAVKYGALSNDVGRVKLSWHVDNLGEEKHFRFIWKECDGPPVKPPSQKGFGSKLIRMGLIGTGGVETSYEADGFRAEMTAGLHQIQHTE